MEFVPGVHDWARRLATLLFPSSCLTCPQDVSFDDGPVCRHCLSGVRKQLHQRATPALLACFSMGPFEGRLKELIHLFKYGGKDYLAPVLAELLVRQWPVPPVPVEALMPVPMPYWRETRRGYNQAALLARELGSRWELPVSEGGIRRRWNRSQTALSRAGRLKNAARGFRLDRRKMPCYKRVLLVDDVLTTGATLDVCGKLLKEAGMETVVALTLAYD